MQEYIVTVKEVHKQQIKVFAKSPLDALDLVEEGEGEAFGDAVYDYTLDSDTWSVEETE